MYNLKCKQDFPVSLTFDIDWAPDFMVLECCEFLKKNSIPATFFATHDSEVMSDMCHDSDFEVGIHPNFLPNTTQGSSIDEIVQSLLQIFPEACSIRTHGLYQTTHLYFNLVNNYPNLKYDFSLCLPKNAQIQPFEYIQDGRVSLVRVPYQWEDDFHYLSQSSWDVREILFPSATYQIFNFHPVHVYLNSSTPDNYNKMKIDMKNNLLSIRKIDAEKYRNTGFGIHDLLTKLVENISADRFVKASVIPFLS